MSVCYSCANCNKVGEIRNGQALALYLPLALAATHGSPLRYCSLDCLTEGAWKLREAQPKLSKSTQV